MKYLFLSAGPWYMSFLTLMLILMTAWMLVSYLRRKDVTKEEFLRKLSYGKSIGLFAFMMGILFHLLGFYKAFAILEQVTEIRPSVFYGGLRVSITTTTYGLIIYVISILFWLLFVNIGTKAEEKPVLS